MIISSSLTDFQNALDLLPKDCTIGFVPTMGALHQGHISLVTKALTHTKYVVASIFVNPTQFNNADDLKRYPRTVEEDCKKLEQAGAYIVFIPSVEDIYPHKTKELSQTDKNVSQTQEKVFDLGNLDKTGEGPRRPGHFNGVAQVVTRLFDIVKPTYAFFGEKDFQQLAIIKYITEKEGYPVKIIACPTIREEDGLAMSSRNMLLSADMRNAAPKIFKILKTAQTEFSIKPTISSISITPAQLTKWVTDEINSDTLLKVEYVEIVNSLTLHIVNSWNQADNIQLCVAIFAGDVRLIDNIKLK